MEITTAQMATIKMELHIEAAPADVWQHLTENIGAWWPDDFYAGGAAGERRFLLESNPGGRMYEEWDSGGGVLWGNVVSIDPNKSLQVLGVVFPNWGGPTQWYGSWTLQEAGGGTLLQFSETGVGRVSDGGMEEKDKGWKFLWASLKAHAEGKPAPAWTD